MLKFCFRLPHVYKYVVSYYAACLFRISSIFSTNLLQEHAFCSCIGFAQWLRESLFSRQCSYYVQKCRTFPHKHELRYPLSPPWRLPYSPVCLSRMHRCSPIDASVEFFIFNTCLLSMRWLRWRICSNPLVGRMPTRCTDVSVSKFPGQLVRLFSTKPYFRYGNGGCCISWQCRKIWSVAFESGLIVLGKS